MGATSVNDVWLYTSKAFDFAASVSCSFLCTKERGKIVHNKAYDQLTTDLRPFIMKCKE